MIHKQRRYRVRDVATPEELAELLVDHSWCLCNGFRLGGTLWLNDAFSESGAQEFAVIAEASGVQVESLTVSWMNRSDVESQAIHWLEVADRVAADDRFFRVTEFRVDHPAGTCGFCA